MTKKKTDLNRFAFLAFVGVPVLLYLLFLGPMFDNVGRLKTEVAGLKEQRSNLELQVARLGQLQAEERQLTAELERLKEQIPKRLPEDSLATIIQLAKTHKLRLGTVDQSEPESGNGVLYYPFAINGEGGFESTLNFLSDLEELGVITSVSLSEGGTSEVALQASVNVLSRQE